MTWLEDLREGFGLPTLAYAYECSEKQDEVHSFTTWLVPDDPKSRITVEGDTYEEALNKLDKSLGPLRPAIPITGGQPVSDPHRERCQDPAQVLERECCLTPDTPVSVVRNRPQFPGAA